MAFDPALLTAAADEIRRIQRTVRAQLALADLLDELAPLENAAAESRKRLDAARTEEEQFAGERAQAKQAADAQVVAMLADARSAAVSASQAAAASIAEKHAAADADIVSRRTAADTEIAGLKAEPERLAAAAKAEADRVVTGARAEADRLLADAKNLIEGNASIIAGHQTTIKQLDAEIADRKAALTVLATEAMATEKRRDDAQAAFDALARLTR